MEKPTHPFCSVFGHNLKLVAKIDDDISELVCKTCQSHFISTENGSLVDLPVLRDTNPHESYFKRKRASSRLQQFLGA